VPSTPTLSPPKSSPAKTNAFVNDSHDKSSKLAELEASGIKNYVLVASPTVCHIHFICWTLLSPIYHLWHDLSRVCNSYFSYISLFLGWFISKK
jgi:hypothetical protein